MKSLAKYLPISIIKLLNDFNTSIIDYRKEFDIDTFESNITLNSQKLIPITITYIVKETNYFFSLVFIPIKDQIEWKFYPNSSNSSKPRLVSRRDFDEKILNNLKNDLNTWRKNIIERIELNDPLDFFKDSFIKTYSAEIIDFVKNDKSKEHYPLTIEKQIQVIELINQQKTFVKQQIENEKDKSSEKYLELKESLNDLDNLKDELPRLTINELKKRWSNTFAVLIKWCGKQLASFAKIDAENDGNISRSIGSLIGGFFNVPS